MVCTYVCTLASNDVSSPSRMYVNSKTWRISLGLFDINQTANVFSFSLSFTVSCCAARFTISKFDYYISYITIISSTTLMVFDFQAPPTTVIDVIAASLSTPKKSLFQIYDFSFEKTTTNLNNDDKRRTPVISPPVFVFFFFF